MKKKICLSPLYMRPDTKVQQIQTNLDRMVNTFCLVKLVAMHYIIGVITIFHSKSINTYFIQKIWNQKSLVPHAIVQDYS